LVQEEQTAEKRKTKQHAPDHVGMLGDTVDEL
jgi:hypothetical protein